MCVLEFSPYITKSPVETDSVESPFPTCAPLIWFSRLAAPFRLSAQRPPRRLPAGCRQPQLGRQGRSRWGRQVRAPRRLGSSAHFRTRRFPPRFLPVTRGSKRVHRKRLDIVPEALDIFSCCSSDWFISICPCAASLFFLILSF